MTLSLLKSFCLYYEKKERDRKYDNNKIVKFNGRYE